MEKYVLSENELAERWGVSPKTLQRWRNEGRGPRYLKLSKRVTYPLVEVTSFERNALYASTSERAQQCESPSSSNLLTAAEAAAAMGMPVYLFGNKKVRDAAGIPCLHINASLRFKLHDVMAWAQRCATESER